MKKCVFAGTFDPITNGHMHVIERCAMMFDEVVVAIGVNENKKCKYSRERRLEMLYAALKRFQNVTVKYFDGMVADFLRAENAVYYVRGVRNDEDVKFEEKCFEVTGSLNENVQLMLFPAPPAFKNVSSTFIRKLIDEGKSVAKFVPEEIIPLL